MNKSAFTLIELSIACPPNLEERSGVPVDARQGFTLIELSIVLVIIGLIVGGVLVGQDLIKAAKLRAIVARGQALYSRLNCKAPFAVGKNHNVKGQLCITTIRLTAVRCIPSPYTINIMSKSTNSRFATGHE